MIPTGPAPPVQVFSSPSSSPLKKLRMMRAASKIAVMSGFSSKKAVKPQPKLNWNSTPGTDNHGEGEQREGANKKALAIEVAGRLRLPVAVQSVDLALFRGIVVRKSQLKLN